MNYSKESRSERLNPFFSIWTKPRQTLRQVIDENNSKFIFLLLLLAGYSAVLVSVIDTNSNETLGVWSIVIGGLIAGPLIALFGNLLGAGLSVWIGRIFKGTSTFEEMFRALLAGQIPQIWMIPVLLLWIFLSPSSYFTVSIDEYSGGDLVLNLILSSILSVVSVWTFVVQSKAIGEAHGFSAWKGAAVIFIPLVIIAIIGLLFIISAVFS
ncbi:Yip1 family protein [Planococcus beigongshangi]|uniref:Yip1 family protein n=1 Tax=Planococcus beigongshangi TaxID=2782536 RepID=UPI00193B5297|nr:Yip1 family protein [Planococcus beigongshangi]